MNEVKMRKDEFIEEKCNQVEVRLNLKKGNLQNQTKQINGNQ